MICSQANQEHEESKRQYAHVFHKQGVICVAREFFDLPETHQLGILLHEAGHIWAGERAGEDAANRAAKRHSGVTVWYKDGPHGERVEWIPPEKKAEVRAALGLN